MISIIELIFAIGFLVLLAGGTIEGNKLGSIQIKEVLNEEVVIEEE